MSTRGVRIGYCQGDVRLGKHEGQSEAVQRFRDHKAEMRDWFPGEVTNEVALSVILDVYALHQEREGEVAVE